jgi:hypothetical protein
MTDFGYDLEIWPDGEICNRMVISGIEDVDVDIIGRAGSSFGVAVG